jgi:RNA polymerase sigma factor (sigma-70 family)
MTQGAIMTRQPQREDEFERRRDEQAGSSASPYTFADGSQYRELIDQYAYVVKAVISRLDCCLPPEVDRGLLIGKAIMALVDTAHQTPPGDFFEQQARSNIWKTIVKWLADQPWLRRRLKQSADRLYEAYIAVLQRMEHTRRSSDGPLDPGALARQLQVTDVQLEQWLNEVGAYFTAWPRSFLGVDESVGAIATDVEFAQQTSMGCEASPKFGPAKLATLISKLPPRARLVVTLSHYEELSHDEIAMIMDIPVEEVRRTYAEAGLQLRAMLADAA